MGTEKGLFRVHVGHGSGHLRIDGPHLAGYRVLHTVAAPAQPRELLAAVDHPVWGSHIHRSSDGGETWTSLDATPRHPPRRHAQSLNSIWHLAWSPDGSTLYAGIDPAGLFVSDDRGTSWRDVPALNEHVTRDAWEPSRGLFALHSICVDRQNPAHLVVAVSAGGVYRSEDAAASWSPANAGVRAENLPERFPVAGHNVHRVVMHPADGRRLYRQCYNGTYRSDDGGDRGSRSPATCRATSATRLPAIRSTRTPSSRSPSRVRTCGRPSTAGCAYSAARTPGAAGRRRRPACRSSTPT